MVKGTDTMILVCQKCGEEFVFTQEAQDFLRKRGFTEVPRWCRSCFHQAKRAEKRRQDHDSRHA
jgi:hypothetical protein